MELANTIFYFLVVISILVVVHEFGHFIAARLSKMRVEIFSLFMGYRLFGYNKKTGFTFGNLPEDFDGEGYCDYRLSLFPFGGYVKISGMIDESFDKKFAYTEPKEYEFRAKNPFLKALTISGGVIMNFLLAWALFAIIAFSKGDTNYLTTTIGYVEKGSVSEKVGLMNNDKIISINGKEVNSWHKLLENITFKELGKEKHIVLERNGERKDLIISGDSVVKALSNKTLLGIYPSNSNLVILDLETLKPAAKAGMQAGDTILSVNGEKLVTAAQLRATLANFKQSKVHLVWYRNGQILSDSIQPDSDGLLGVKLAEIYTGAKEFKQYGVMASIGYGWDQSIATINLFYSVLKQIFTGGMSAKNSLGGPIMIAKQASQTAEMGILALLNFIALLSITLAVINILPVPALDGGHLVIIIIEGIIRRELPFKVKMAIQQVGFVLILALMAFAIYNDIMR